MKKFENKGKIIDAVEYDDGKYTDSKVLRNRIISAVAAVVLVAGFILVPVLIL